MRYLSLLFICLNLTPTAVWGQSKMMSSVLETESLRFGAMTRKDTAFLKNLLSDDLVYIHSNGLTETKQEHLHAIASGAIVYRSMDRKAGTRMRRYGKWAITNGAMHVTGLLNGNPFELQLRYTAIYRKKKGMWRLLNWQSTRV